MFACIVLMIFASVMILSDHGAGHVSAATSKKPQSTQNYMEASYSKYLSSHGYDGQMASSTSKVNLLSYQTSNGMEASMNGGAVITGSNGKITWHVSVQKAGFYNIAVTYLPVKGTNAKIIRRLTIDGKNDFVGMNQLVFNRLWDNSGGKPIMQNKGNEILPVSVEKPELSTVYLGDSKKRNLEPYKFYLSAGTHTLTLESVQEPLEITDITLKAAPEVKPYADVIKAWKQKYKIYGGANLVYQAERTNQHTIDIEKSSESIVMSTDYSNPDTVPYSPYKVKLNTIGGSSWKTPGDFIRWRIDVPEEGLYRISFRGKQNTNRGVTSFRELKVNGQVPFREAMDVPFGFHSGFVNYVPGNNGGPFLIHLKKGQNTISLVVVLGRFAEPLSEVEKSVFVLNGLYRKTVQITGLVPDKYIDYQITKKIPGYAKTFKAENDRLKKVVDELVNITGEKGEKTAIIAKMQVQAEELSKHPENVVNQLSELESNISAMGTWITSISEMPLELDSFALSAPQSKLPQVEPNVIVRAYSGVVRFVSTFLVNQSTLSDNSNKKALKVWVSAGRDQAQIIKNMIDQNFTPKTNIPVDLQLVPENVLLPASLAGSGPDVALTVPQETVVNFAMRHALVDLSKLNGFDGIKNKFNDGAIRTVSYQNGVYGLPEQQMFMMLYYREDILNQLGLKPPKTWDDVEKMIAVLHTHNYDFYIPAQAPNSATVYQSAQSLFPSLVYQYGGDLYKGSGKDYGIQSGLTDDEDMNAFNRFTRFFTSYRLPVAADFSNRFRTGQMPVGVALYTEYNQLQVFAPEIRGLWTFAPLPGVKAPDGSIDNSAISETKDTIMMKSSKHKKEAWKFMQWWLQTDTQTQYAHALEAVMGAAARYPTANIQVLKQLPWPLKDKQELLKQFKHTVGVPEVPGSYMTPRAFDYAFRSVVTSGENPREALYMNTKQVNKELTKMRKKFHLSYIHSK